jgi:hypothetical protein
MLLTSCSTFDRLMIAMKALLLRGLHARGQDKLENIIHRRISLSLISLRHAYEGT